MSRISTVFKQGNRKALIAYITVGYPSLESTADTALLLAEAGCDIIELGIPFSDPLADGVTIQNATHQALLNGATVNKCLETAKQIRSKVKTPLAFMGYHNPVLNYGPAEFCAACAAAGIDGLIIPDLPPGPAWRTPGQTKQNPEHRSRRCHRFDYGHQFGFLH
jgi:tryptophan synthase alpha chain